MGVWPEIWPRVVAGGAIGDVANVELPSRVAARLAQASFETLEAELEHCLHLTGREFRLSLVTLARRDGSVLRATHQWRDVGQMDPPLEIDLASAHWIRDQLDEDEDVIIDDTSALPSVAEYESGYFAARMTGAVIALAAGRSAYLVAEMQRDARVWTRAEIDALTEIAGHIGSAQAAHDEQRELVVRAQRASRDSEGKSRFIATLAHELRTPLTAIIGYSQLLGAESVGALTNKQERFVRDILACAEHLERIVNESLDLAKLDAGRLALTLDEHDACELARAAALNVRAQAEAAGIELVLELPDKPIPLLADDLKVQQILINLLTNAIKFTESGSVTLRIRDGGGDVMMLVEDTGPGIAPSNHHRIFDSFARVHRSRSSNEGTGLGLSLVKRLVALHGGRVDVDSDLGRGATFIVSLPRRARPATTGRPAFLGGQR